MSSHVTPVLPWWSENLRHPLGTRRTSLHLHLTKFFLNRFQMNSQDPDNIALQPAASHSTHPYPKSYFSSQAACLFSDDLIPIRTRLQVSCMRKEGGDRPGFFAFGSRPWGRGGGWGGSGEPGSPVGRLLHRLQAPFATMLSETSVLEASTVFQAD